MTRRFLLCFDREAACWQVCQIVISRIVHPASRRHGLTAGTKTYSSGHPQVALSDNFPRLRTPRKLTPPPRPPSAQRRSPHVSSVQPSPSVHLWDTIRKNFEEGIRLFPSAQLLLPETHHNYFPIPDLRDLTEKKKKKIESVLWLWVNLTRANFIRL